MNNLRLLYTMGILLTFVLTNCKQSRQDILQEKVNQAIASRKIPTEANKKNLFAEPNWPLERSQRNSERVRNLENYLPTIGINQGVMEVTHLPLNIDPELGKSVFSSAYFEKQTSLDLLCESKNLNGVIILHKGQIVYEQYPDMNPGERHVIYSISKSFVGTVIACLADDGLLNENDQLELHIEEFKGKAIGKVSINDVLRMASGLNCRELTENAFTDPNENFYKFLQYRDIYPAPEQEFKQSLIEFFANVGVVAPAGQINDYTTANTVLLSLLAERVSDLPYHELVSKYIWTQIGAEDEARISLSDNGIAGSGGFMMARLRDIARYGLAFTNDAPVKIASDRYLNKIRIGDKDLFMTDKSFADIFEGQGASHNSYQWDIVFEDGDFAKFGFGGQGLYVSPDKRLVIAYFNANKNDGFENMSLYYLSRSLALLDRFGK